MASSSKKPVKGRGGGSCRQGRSFRSGVRTPRGPEDDGSSSESVLGITGASWRHIRPTHPRPVMWPGLQISERFEIFRFRGTRCSLYLLFFISNAQEPLNGQIGLILSWTDRGFCDCLERAGVLRSILISRGSNMYRDTEALRQLVRRWCPSTHTFFFAHGEMTVTLEDVENHWLLPILGDQGPSRSDTFPLRSWRLNLLWQIILDERTFALGTQAARFKPWMEHFNRETKPFDSEGLLFGFVFPLPPLLLGQIYTQLDLLHAEELAGASCHIVSTAFNSSIVHTFLWEHALEYIKKGRKPYEGRNKFASMPDGVVANVGDFQGDVPTVYRWVGSKFYDHSLIPSLDNEKAQDYSLIAGDTASLTYLSATNAGWLPVLSSDGLRFTVKFPPVNPFLRDRAFCLLEQGLMAAMVEFRNSGRGDISHLLESYTSPLPHPRLFVATNTMTTYADRQSLGYAVWHYEDSRWVIHGSPHPPLWLRDHPHVAASGKAPSSRGKRNVAPAVLHWLEEDVPQGVSAPISKKPVKKTRAGKKTFVPPAFPSAPSSIAARVAVRKSSRGGVYSEKRSKQRADTSSRVPIEIPDDLDSSSSSSDPSGAVERESVGAGVAETASGADDFAADISSADIGSIDTDALLSASSGEKDARAGVNPMSAEEAIEEHATVGVAGPSGSSSHVDPSLLDSSPSTRQYVRRARRGSIVSTDSERTGSATVRVSTPPSPLPESGGIASTPIIIAAAVSAATIIQESETAPAAVGEVPWCFDAGIAQIEHAEVAASEDPVQAEVIPGSDVPVIEEELAQDPADDIDMADAHDSYDEVLAEAEDDVAGAQAADTGATTPVAAHGSPTEDRYLAFH
uniref:Aminotransferase-like plant mobile domain-containing protein n=1 Tax=Fagus sylvatica TaxID=28930 RepID=A0A2N9FU85_FAGSY